jgi:hypothetical protein
MDFLRVQAIRHETALSYLGVNDAFWNGWNIASVSVSTRITSREMKYIILLISLIVITSCSSSKNNYVRENEITESKQYNSVAAKKYGADQYGMKSYVIAFLKEGPNRDLDSNTAAELQAAHMAILW